MTMKQMFRAIWYGIRVVLWSPIIFLTIFVGMPISAIYFVAIKKLFTLKEILLVFKMGLLTGINRDIFQIRTGMTW